MNDNTANNAQLKYEKNLKCILEQAGFIGHEKIAETLQGQIWKSYKKKYGEQCVIKVTSKKLHKQSSIIVDGAHYEVRENILREKQIIQYLSSFTDCPQSIVRYKGFFKSNTNYYLIMEDGGSPIFDFILKAHKMIQLNKIHISEWQNLVKIIFKKMIEGIQFLHKKNICHFDISLENTLINDIKILIENPNEPNEKVKFLSNYDDINVKIVDFGVAEIFDQNKNIKKQGENVPNFQSNKYCGKRAYQSPEIIYEKTSFNAAQNDVWCLGVCLFMMITGGAPFYRAHHDDESYKHIMEGNIKYLLTEWDRLSYFDEDLLDLITSIFQYEDQRISLQEIKEHQWLKN